MTKVLTKIKDFIFQNKVAVMFLILSVLGVLVSGQPVNGILLELLTRLGRNGVLVISLIIPVITGMGLNFSITVGAMATQVGVFFAMYIIQMYYPHCPPLLIFLLALSFALPLSILFGFFIGNMLNSMKGSEMIGGLILGYFSDGLYQLFFLYIIGGVIPIVNKNLLINTGIGVKNTIELSPTKKFSGLKYAIDGLWRLPLVDFIKFIFLIAVLYAVFRWFRDGKKFGRIPKQILTFIAVTGILSLISFLPPVVGYLKNIRIPVATYALILLMCWFTNWFLQTRIGQNMRAVGQNRAVANSAGINVDKTRLTAIIISTAIASFGQLIYLQNIGVLTTYGAHLNVGLFSIAALLVGGASVYKASVGQAILGVLLFHTLFIVSPLAGQTLMNNAMIGEYFRVFVCYGVIAMSLAMHVWSKRKA